MTRQEANRKIITLLMHQIETNPDLRFSQIVHNLGMLKEIGSSFDTNVGETIDYYEESVVTLGRMLGE
jgi:hypothetical protein